MSKLIFHKKSTNCQELKKTPIDKLLLITVAYVKFKIHSKRCPDVICKLINIYVNRPISLKTYNLKHYMHAYKRSINLKLICEPVYIPFEKWTQRIMHTKWKTSTCNSIDPVQYPWSCDPTSVLNVKNNSFKKMRKILHSIELIICMGKDFNNQKRISLMFQIKRQHLPGFEFLLRYYFIIQQQHVIKKYYFQSTWINEDKYYRYQTQQNKNSSLTKQNYSNRVIHSQFEGILCNRLYYSNLLPTCTWLDLTKKFTITVYVQNALINN